MTHREETPLSGGGLHSVMSSRQNPLTSKSIEDKSDNKQSNKNKHNNKLVQNFISLFRKNNLDRYHSDLKKQMFSQWRKHYLYTVNMKINGLRIYKSLHLLTKLMNKRIARLKHAAFIKMKQQFALSRFKEEVTPRLVRAI